MALPEKVFLKLSMHEEYDRWRAPHRYSTRLHVLRKLKSNPLGSEVYIRCIMPVMHRIKEEVRE